MLTKRLLFGFFILFTAFILNWYVAFFLIAFSVIVFGFPEMIFYAFMLDLLWAKSSPWYMRFVFTLSTVFLLYGARFLKKHMRTNRV